MAVNIRLTRMRKTGHNVHQNRPNLNIWCHNDVS